jgi:hypothetical protein
MQEPLMCAISRRGVGPVHVHPKNISNYKGGVSRELVFTRGGNPAGNPDMKAVGEPGLGGAAFAAAGRKRKAEGGTHPPGGWTLKEEEAVRRACEATKGKGYEEAYEVYMRATARSLARRQRD